MPIEDFTSWREADPNGLLAYNGQWYMTEWRNIQFPHKQTTAIRKWVYRIVHHLIEQAKPKIEVTFDEEIIFKGRRKRL